jgi:predicted  nucleic acid-binding Zn-ribbon protein
MKNIIENLLKLQTAEAAATTGAETGKQLAGWRAKIPAQILGHYDRLRARGKKGVAVIKGQTCGECHVQVPRNTVLTLMHGTDIQICENCGRYLCLPEHVNPAQPPVKTKKNKAKPAALLQAA